MPKKEGKRHPGHQYERYIPDIGRQLGERRQAVFNRFPLLFTLLGAFGLVATFYGFENIIDTIPLLANNPYIMLGVGLATLVFTGGLYKYLGK